MKVLVVSRYTTDRRSATVVYELNKIPDVNVFNLTWSDHPELHPLRNMFRTGLDSFNFPQFCCHFDRPNTADPKALEMCLRDFRPHVVVLTSEVYEPGTHEQIKLCHQYGAKVALVGWQNTMTEEKEIRLKPFIQETYKLADMILVGSTYALEWHKKFGEANFEVVPFLAVKEGLSFPVKKENFIRSEPKRIRDEWKDKFVVSYIGRFLEWKGLNYIVDAMDELMTKNDDICFFAVGGGFSTDSDDVEVVDKLWKFVNKWEGRAYVFPFAKEADHINEYYNISDISLYPSLPKHGRIIEQFGIAMVECALAGIPCVGPNIGGATDIIKNKVTGYLIEPGKSKAIVEAIEHYRNLNPTEKWKMREETIVNSKQWLGSNIAKKIFGKFSTLFVKTKEEKDEENRIKKYVQFVKENVSGFLSDDDCMRLYEIAKDCKDGAIVEIGSWKGKSSCILGKASKDNHKVPVLAIDPFSGSSEHQSLLQGKSTYDEFLENIKKCEVDHIVKGFRMTSEEARKQINTPISFLFIDGSHEYEDVKLDWELWYNDIIVGGVVMFHDARFDGWEGPRKVIEQIDETLVKEGIFEKIDALTPTYRRMK